jgi:hypothetical protein
MWRYVAGGTVSTGAVTVALWLGLLDDLALVIVALVILGMWLWSNDDRTRRFNSSIDSIRARARPPQARSPRRPRASPSMEAEGSSPELSATPDPPRPRAARGRSGRTRGASEEVRTIRR